MKLHTKRSIRAAAAWICSFVLISSFSSVQAAGISDLENKTSELQNQLNGINQEMLDISNEITATEMQIEILNGEILRTQDDLTVAEENEAHQYEDMKARIKYMYEFGNASMLEMLFSAEDMVDFLNKAEFIQSISDYDRSMLEELRTIQKGIAEQKQTLVDQQSSLSGLQAELEGRHAELQAAADATSTDLAAFTAQLQQLREEEARRAEEARLAAEAQAAAQAAAEAAAAGNTTDNGSGAAPAPSAPSDGGGSTIVNGGATSVSGSELDVFAAILECEAYQSYDALLAVATVIMNRVNSPLFPNSISGVVYASGQFEPVWTGRLAAVLSRGPSSLSYQVAQDALGGARLASVANCYYFLYAGSTSRPGVNVGNNLFFPSW